MAGSENPWQYVYQQLDTGEKPSLFELFKCTTEVAQVRAMPASHALLNMAEYSKWQLVDDITATFLQKPGRQLTPTATARAAAYVSHLRALSAKGERYPSMLERQEAGPELVSLEPDYEEEPRSSITQELLQSRPYGVALNALHCGSWRVEEWYQGQLIAGVNVLPPEPQLELQLLHWRATATQQQVQSFKVGSGAGCNSVFSWLLVEQLPAFQVSRRFRISVSLSHIARVHLYHAMPEGMNVKPHNAADCKATLTLELAATPQFHVCRVRTASILDAEFRPCGDWSQGSQLSRHGRLTLVGDQAAVELLAAMLLEASPTLASQVAPLLAQPLPPHPPQLAPPPSLSEASAATNTALRSAILNVLHDHRLIDEHDVAAPCNDMQNGTRCSVNNRLGHLQERFPSCFVDYLNFRCTDTDELRAFLQKPISSTWADHVLRPTGQGNLPGKSGQKRRVWHPLVADALRFGFDPHQPGQMFWSCCQLAPLAGTQHKHCSRCHHCYESPLFWHCQHCDRCSYSQVANVCEWCGLSPSDPPGHHRPPEPLCWRSLWALRGKAGAPPSYPGTAMDTDPQDVQFECHDRAALARPPRPSLVADAMASMMRSMQLGGQAGGASGIWPTATVSVKSLMESAVVAEEEWTTEDEDSEGDARQEGTE